MPRTALCCRVFLLVGIVALLHGLLPSVSPAALQDYVVGTDWYQGRQVVQIVAPGKPPATYRAPSVDLEAARRLRTTSVLSDVPALDWSYGCSATSAAMLFGHYDRTQYPNMYAGPTNGGVFPLPTDSTIWGQTAYTSVTCMECPLSATHNGVDGRATRGHVDDYWIDYGNAGPDPWISNSWAEHTQGDCTGDYMGTNQSSVGNSDGGTTFAFYTNGDPLHDYTGSEPGMRDGCHGMRLFAQSRGYTVQENFNQLTYPNNHPWFVIDHGFTFSDFVTQINAGRPVLIHVEGHTMLGFGYDTATQNIYIHDTWDYSDHTMPWGGSYSGLLMYGASVMGLAGGTVDDPPSVTVTSPTDGAHVLADSVTVQGSALDDGTVTLVQVRVNGGSWGDATGTTSWSETVSLGLGSNTIEVRAQDNSSQWSPVQSLEVIRDAVTTKDWTFLVYIDGDNNLEGAAIDDLNEMETVGSNADMHVAVQIDRISGYDSSNGDWTGCRRYYVIQDSNTSTIGSQLMADLGEVNMGAGATLQSFIEWGVASFPANNYAVVLWNHGGGWREIATYQQRACCWDDTDGGDCLYTQEWAQAITDAGSDIAMLGFDVCFGGMMEMVHQAASTGLVDAMAASPATEPGDGWDYATLLTALAATPGMTGTQLADAVVTAYAAFYPGDTMTAYDLSAEAAAAAAVSNFATTCISQDAEWVAAIAAQGAAQAYSYNNFRDLEGFLSGMTSVGNAAIATAASGAVTALQNMVTSYHAGSGYPAGRGTSIELSTDGVPTDYTAANLAWVNDTAWEDFLQWLSEGPAPDGEVLIVDDDGGGGYESYYMVATVTALSTMPEVWDSDSQGAVPASKLNEYLGKLVIWFTGDDYWDTLSISEQTALSVFLDAGGRLFISGQDIGYSIGSSPFYANYLHASYVNDYVNLWDVHGVAGDPISYPWTGGPSFAIAGGSGADNQWYSDEVDPIGSGATFLTYFDGGTSFSPPATSAPSKKSVSSTSRGIISTGTAGIRADTGVYKVVYLSFGFEAIASVSDRESLLANAADWLLTGVQEEPSVFIASPADGSIFFDTSVEVTGSAYDNNDVSLVQVRVNGGSWVDATGTSPWSHTVDLAMGNNVIEARAQDNESNWSLQPYPSITVSREEITHKTWAFLVYLDADNNLEEFGIDDLNEMEAVGSTADVHIAVQLDRIPGYDTSNGDWTGCRRYYVTQDTDPATIHSAMVQDLGEVNMGDPATLEDFVTWGTSNLPADNYAVILWNHGGGWREKSDPNRDVCYDDTDGDVLYTSELYQAFTNAGAPLSMVGFDVCLGGMIEVAHDLSSTGLISAMAASPASEPASGWPYETILGDLAADPTMSGVGLADVVVTRYGQSQPDWTMSAYDLSAMPTASSAASDFAAAMMRTNSEWRTIHDCWQALTAYDWVYLDIREFAELVRDNVNSPDITSAASAFADALDNVVSSFYAGHGGRGVSASFPDDGPEAGYDSSALHWCADTYWDEFLAFFADADRTPPPMPTLHPISNPNQIGDYTLTWDEVFDPSGIANYVVREFEPPVTVLEDDAEGGTAAWTMSGFALSGARSHSPTHSFWSGAANDLSQTMTLATAVTVPSGGTVTLSYWTWYDIEYGYDVAGVEVSANGGSWELLRTFTGYAPAWTLQTDDLTAYAGQSVSLRFFYVTDSSVIYEGIYFDDITIQSLTSTGTWEVAGDQTSLDLTARPVGEWHYDLAAVDGAGNPGDVTPLQATTVTNNAPQVASVSISPDPADTEDDLTATPQGFSDDDGDPAGYHWLWEVDKGSGYSEVSGANSDTLSHDNFERGDTVRVTCTPEDGRGRAIGSAVSADIVISNARPTAPTCAITPAAPVTGDDLVAEAAGSTDADGDNVTYEIQWRKSTDSGGTWAAWGNAGETLDHSLTAKGELWQARARADDGTDEGNWTVSASVEIGNTAPTAPVVAITPEVPGALDDLVATVSTDSDDADGDTVTYAFEWQRIVRDGSMEERGGENSTLPASETSGGETWRCVVTPNDGTEDGTAGQAEVTIATPAAPTAPTVCTISPEEPRTADDLTASASGSTSPGGGTVTYEFEWRESADGGATWSAWGNDGATLSQTQRGDLWQARARAWDGANYSPWTQSDSVEVLNTPPTSPTSCALAPEEPGVNDDIVPTASGSEDDDANDTIAYRYEYRSSGDAGGTWTAWGNAGDTLSHTLTSGGEQWQARARADDGDATSAWTESDPVIVYGITFSGGPTANPNPVGSGGNVACSVSAIDTLGTGFVYLWSAQDPDGNPAGAFDDPTKKSPIWTAPVNSTGYSRDYTLTVHVSSASNAAMAGDASTTVTVLPGMMLNLFVGWNMGTAGDAADVTASIGDLVGSDVVTAYRWDSQQFRYELLDLANTTGSSICGCGTWLMALTESSRSMTVQSATEHVIAVARGWNLLANPYGCAFDLDTGMTTSGGNIIRPCYIWNGQVYSYQTTTVIPAGASFWALSDFDGEITLGPAGMTPEVTTAAVSLANRPADSAASMCLQLVAEAAGTTDEAIWLGISADGEADMAEKPPVAPNSVGAYLDVADGIGYARSLVPQGATATWTLTVNSPADEECSLRIADTSLLAGDMAVWLVDQATGKRVDLRHAPEYTYTARDGQRRFVIEIGEREDLLQVMGVSTHPAGAGAQISFTLSAPGAVTVDVLNIAGRTVKRIVTARECEAGPQTLSWNGVSDRGTRVPGGVYLVRVTGAAATGEQSQGLATMRLR